MAFGKDRAKVGQMNLRQQMKRGAKRPPKSGGRGGPYFTNRYVPPETSGPGDVVRIIPGIYPMPLVDFDAKDFVRNEAGQPVLANFPYFKYIDYFHATKSRGCIGSEGPLGDFRGKGDPCVAADWFWWEYRQRQKTGAKTPKSIRRTEKFAFTVLVQAPFYKVPRLDDQQKPVISEKTGQPYYDWVKGSKRGNDEFAAAGYERKDGHLQHWSLGIGHWNTLSEYADSLARHCRHCGKHNSIEEVALVCQNPDCGEAVVIMESTNLSDEDLAKLRDEEVLCPHCKMTGYLQDMIRCTNCNRGEQATLFDFDLEVKRVKVSSDGGNQTNLQIIQAIGPQPLDQRFGDDLRKPLDLPNIFSPTPIEKQIEIFGSVPADDTPARQPSNTGSRPYGS